MYFKLRMFVFYRNSTIWYMISVNFKWKIYLFLTLINTQDLNPSPLTPLHTLNDEGLSCSFLRLLNMV